MSGQAIAVPAELEGAMRRFARDFDAVSRQWIEAGHETPQSIADAHANLRKYLAASSDPDEYGVPRVVRMRQVFDHWRALALQVQTQKRTQGVQPVLSLTFERKQAAKLAALGR